MTRALVVGPGANELRAPGLDVVPTGYGYEIPHHIASQVQAVIFLLPGENRIDHHLSILDVVEFVQPEVLVIEEVRGLSAPRQTAILRHLLEGLNGAGYDVERRILRSEGQRRTVIVGRRESTNLGPVNFPRVDSQLVYEQLVRWNLQADHPNRLDKTTPSR